MSNVFSEILSYLESKVGPEASALYAKVKAQAESFLKSEGKIIAEEVISDVLSSDPALGVAVKAVEAVVSSPADPLAAIENAAEAVEAAVKSV